MSDNKLATRVKLAFGATDIGFSTSYTIITFFFLYYLTDVVGLKPLYAGAALLVGKFWDAIIDPAIGHFSDRLQTRWGRRRPFFLFGAVPYGLTFLLLWNLPQLHNQLALAVVTAVVFMLHITASSLASVPYTALAPELTQDYDERTSLTAYRMAFSIIAGLAAAVLPGMIVGAFSPARVGYGVMGAIFAALIAVCPLFVFFGTREPVRERPVQGDSFVAGVIQCFKNGPFIAALVMYLANWVGMDIISTTFVYYLKYYLHMEANTSIVLGLIFGTAALCLPLWVKISEAIGKKLAYGIGLSFLSAVLLSLMFLRQQDSSLAYLLSVLAGVGVSAAHVLSNAIIPDVIDYDELKTGKRREGVYFGMVTFVQQFASAGALALVGLILELSGYVPNVEQTTRALWGIRLMIGLGPGLLFAVGIVALVFYPLNKKRFNQVRQELHARRGAVGM